MKLNRKSKNGSPQSLPATAPQPAGIVAKRALFFGNPILDLMKETGVEYILQHNLNPDTEEFRFSKSEFPDIVQEIFTDFANDSTVEKVAGGASQNSARVSSYMSRVFGENMNVTFTGAVAKDDLAQCMRSSCADTDVSVMYQENDGCISGSCAALFYTETADNLTRLGQTCKPSGRTLVTCLEAAGRFDDAKFDEAMLADFDMFYTEGFFIPTSFATLLKAAKHAKATGKPFVVNLSSAFIVGGFVAQFMELLPYATIIFGNEIEFPALWTAMIGAGNLTERNGGWDHESFALYLGSQFGTPVALQERTVVISRGTDPAVVYDPSSKQVVQFPVFKLKDSSMFKDTNAAGDSYVGGFLSAVAVDLPLGDAMQRAALGGGINVQMRGCSFPKNQTEFDRIVGNLDAPADFVAKAKYHEIGVVAPSSAA